MIVYTFFIYENVYFTFQWVFIVKMFGNFVLWENIELRRLGEDSILTIGEIRSGGLRVCWVDERRRGRTREGC